MLTSKSVLPPLAGLFGKSKNRETSSEPAANNDDTAIDAEHQADLNRRSVAFTASKDENLAA